MHDFAYLRPETVEAAVAALTAPDARVLAGGTDLVPQLREGRRTPAHVVDLKRVAGMSAIDVLTDGSVTIGAAASATSIAAHPHIGKHFPAVAEACRLIGSWQIQNRATLAGNVCNAAPSADGVPPLICHAATARIAGPSGTREVLVEALFAGPGRTTLAASEIVTALHLPASGTRSASAYLRFTPRREMDIAIAGAGAWISLDGAGRIAQARIALASVAPTPIRAPSAEKVMIGQQPTRALFESAGQAASADARPISDTRGTADYRRHLVGVLTRRTLAQCLFRLGIEIEAS